MPAHGHKCFLRPLCFVGQTQSEGFANFAWPRNLDHRPRRLRNAHARGRVSMGQGSGDGRKRASSVEVRCGLTPTIAGDWMIKETGAWTRERRAMQSVRLLRKGG